MKSKNVRNIQPSPSIPIKLTPRNAENVEKYDLKRLQDHVLFRFQPTHIMKVPKEDYTAEQIKQLEDWWHDLKIENRDSPFVSDSLGVAIIWTFCGGDDADPDNGVYGDDCE